MRRRFGLVGSDSRMKTACELLKKDGYDSKMLGMGSSFEDVDVIVLSPSCDFKSIEHKCKDKIVFAPFNANGCINYLEIEEFKKQNAIPSAEGAVCYLMSQTQSVLYQKRIAVVGYGCIGKELYRILTGIGSFVTVFARGNKNGTMPVSELVNQYFDVIINTVPAKVIDKDLLCSLACKPIIMDLASRPGGVDFETAQSLGLKCTHELSIPGRYAPDTAGEILKNTVLSYLRGVK